jgi:phosphoribosylamine--glycine ligase
VFHAGTALDASGQLVASGGRVLAVTGLADSAAAARARAYDAVAKIDWPEGFYRRDIAGS